MAFGTENAVYPAVFVRRETHVVNVGGGNHIFGHRDGIVPEAEVVNAVGAFGHGKERLAVGSLHAHHQYILSVPLDGSRIQGSIHSDAFHQVGVGLLVQIITPKHGRVCGGQYRMLITGDNAVFFFLRFITT